MLMGETVRRSNAGFPKKRVWITEKHRSSAVSSHCSESFFGAPRECPSEDDLVAMSLEYKMKTSGVEKRVSN
jgi:hypothetical protein